MKYGSCEEMGEQMPSALTHILAVFLTQRRRDPETQRKARVVGQGRVEVVLFLFVPYTKKIICPLFSLPLPSSASLRLRVHTFTHKFF